MGKKKWIKAAVKDEKSKAQAADALPKKKTNAVTMGKMYGSGKK